MKYQGNEREYYVYVPETLYESRPLVFMLHGYGGKAEGYFPDMVDCAERHGFVICYPQGLKDPGKERTGWNVGYPSQEGWKVDDCAFILALARKLCREYGLDKRNVFFSGMSNGGEMCYYMAHRYPEKFAAIASLAGLTMEWIYREYKPKCAVPFMEIHGTADKTSLWEGDPVNEFGWGKYISVPSAVARMVSTDCCTHFTVDTLALFKPESHTVVLHKYQGGTDGMEVRLYEVIGGGHSRGEKDIDLPEELWNFFKTYLK